MGYSLWDCKELDVTEQLILRTANKLSGTENQPVLGDPLGYNILAYLMI